MFLRAEREAALEKHMVFRMFRGAVQNTSSSEAQFKASTNKICNFYILIDVMKIMKYNYPFITKENNNSYDTITMSECDE